MPYFCMHLHLRSEYIPLAVYYPYHFEWAWETAFCLDKINNVRNKISYNHGNIIITQCQSHPPPFFRHFNASLVTSCNKAELFFVQLTFDPRFSSNRSTAVSTAALNMGQRRPNTTSLPAGVVIIFVSDELPLFVRGIAPTPGARFPLCIANIVPTDDINELYYLRAMSRLLNFVLLEYYGACDFCWTGAVSLAFVLRGISCFSNLSLLSHSIIEILSTCTFSGKHGNVCAWFVGVCVKISALWSWLHSMLFYRFILHCW